MLSNGQRKKQLGRKLLAILVLLSGSACFSSEYNFNPTNISPPLDSHQADGHVAEVKEDTLRVDPGTKPDLFVECSTDSDCLSDDPCSQAICVEGSCEKSTLPIPGCCTQDTDCISDKACTTASCEDTTCVFVTESGCCVESSDCGLSGPCVELACIDESCVSTPLPDCCTSKDQCSDGNSCTDDFCDPSGMCRFKEKDDCCTTNEECDDGYGCTINSCNENSVCETSIKPSPFCCGSDSDCNIGDACATYICTDYTCDVVNSLPLSECCNSDEECVDSSVCTLDTCTSAGCTNDFILGCCFADSNCNDIDVCTTDQCINNQCVHTPNGDCCTADAQCQSDEPCITGSCSNSKCVFTPVEDCCTEDNECPSVGSCTEGLCINNSCTTVGLDDCCSSSAGCDDGNDCTTDVCENESCLSFWIDGCCKNDNDCPMIDVECTLSVCQSGVCEVIPDPSCSCTNDNECDDGNSCTSDTCSATGSCANIAIPGCCEDTTVFFDNFNDGSLAPFVANPNTGIVRWQITDFTEFSGPFSAYFGNPAEQNYDAGTSMNGRLRTPTIDLPSDKEGAYLQFWLQPGVFFEDTFTIRVRESAPGSNWVEIWSLWESGEWNFFDPEWEIISLPLNDFAGKSIRIQFRMETGDEWFVGQGPALDDISVVSTCEVSSFCSNSSQCDDGDLCTQDSCQSGECVHSEIPSCCANDGACDDNFACTQDTCGADGQCSYVWLDECCSADEQCNDNNGCTADSCISNSCQNTPLADCCTSNGECNDNDSCTIDLCSDGNCQYQGALTPECCVESTLGNWNFDDATLDGWVVENNGFNIQWHPTLTRSWSPAFSLRFGDPESSSFDNGQIVFGSALSPSFSIPLNGSTQVSAMMFLDVEDFELADQVRLIAVSEGMATELWHKDLESPLTEWFMVQGDLTPWAGKSVQLKLEFDSVDALINEGEGAFVDSIKVETTCGD